mmetsp:Transcript_23026/g.30063  ORF Transcript_23026/g.30063 Transcript_23026/m.30063 type:complete len:82 (-) Transcript_23026:203-448(-)
MKTMEYLGMGRSDDICILCDKCIAERCCKSCFFSDTLHNSVFLFKREFFEVEGSKIKDVTNEMQLIRAQAVKDVCVRGILE